MLIYFVNQIHSEPLNDADVLVEPDWLVLLDILVESLSDVDVDVDSLWLVD